MMNLIKGITFFNFLFFCIISSRAQSISGSAYNIFGVGTLNYTGLPAYQGMSNAGIASRSTEHVNIKNPAALNAITLHNKIFDVGVDYSALNQQTENQTFNTSQGGINALNYWVRLNPKMGLTFGVSQFSDGSYDITDFNANTPVLGSYSSRHIGEGGLSQLYIGTGYSLAKGLDIGMRLNFIFGSLNETESLRSSELATDLVIEEELSFTKALFDFGAQYTFDIGENRSLTLGGTVRHKATTNPDSEVSIINNNADTIISEESTSLIIPPKYGFGASLKWNAWEINLDYELEQWSQNEDLEDYSYQDRVAVALGVAYQKDRFSDNYLDRVTFRMGVGLASSYIKVDQTDFLNRNYSLGWSLPINQKGVFHLGYQHTINGTLENDLIREYVHTISLGFSIKDIWFRKSAYD